MKTKDPKIRIDWDVFAVYYEGMEHPVFQVQRIDEADSITDAEAIECARKLGFICDDGGRVIAQTRPIKEFPLGEER